MNRTRFLTRFLFTRLADHTAQSYPVRPHRQAAVLIILVERENGLHIILTERALHLRHHPGQVSFPGGKHEQFDASLLQTAIRETEEEIGISGDFLEVIGQLAPLYTTSGFEVFPCVAFAKPNFNLKIDVQEVKSTFEVPLAFLLDNKNIYLQHLIANKQRHATYCIPFQNHLIWGATAQIIKNLLQMLVDAD